MNDGRLAKKINKIFVNEGIKVVKTKTDEAKTSVLIEFGKDYFDASCFVNKIANTNTIVIGAEIHLSSRVLTKSFIDRLHATSIKCGVACAPLKYEDDGSTAFMAMNLVYYFHKFSKKDFLMYIESFKTCILAIFNEVNTFLDRDYSYLDLSMFQGVDLDCFDPIEYVAERDDKFNGSWEAFLKKLREEKDERASYVEKCKQFEDVNGIALDFLSEYIVNKLSYEMHHNDEDRSLN